MANLHRLQKQFLDGIFTDNTLILEQIADTKKFTPAQRFQVYQNNTALILTENLTNQFPVVSALVGEKFFANIAIKFIRHTPPISGDMNDYGDSFPAFLKSCPPLAEYPFVPDVAQLELARHHSYLSPVKDVLTLEELSNLTEAQSAQLQLYVQPHVFFVTSKWPIDQIWNLHQNGGLPEDNELEERGCQIITFRAGKQITHWAIPESLFVFIKNVSSFNLQTALEKAMAIDCNFSLPSHLPHLINAQIFQSLRLKKN